MKSPELSEFFSLLGKAKKEKKEEFDNLLKEADINLDVLTSSVVTGIKEAKVNIKRQKKKEEKGVKQLIDLKFTNVVIYADSELIVKQVQGIYKVKNERMKILHNLVLEKLKLIDHWNLVHIRREKNIRADELSKLGMNEAKSKK